MVNFKTKPEFNAAFFCAAEKKRNSTVKGGQGTSDTRGEKKVMAKCGNK
jgi:hypothetical protein